MTTKQKLLFAAGGAVAGVALHNFMKYLSQEVLARWLSDKSRRLELIPVVDDQQLWSELVRLGCPPSGLFAFYSSASGAVTTRQELMHVPIDDHAIVRGHAVFDTCSLEARKLYRLEIHLERLLKSARAARLPLPFGEDDASNVKAMTAIVRATCKASGRADASVRFWLTAGTGNLGVTPKGCTPGFYCLVFGGLPMFDLSDGVAEATVPESLVPMKPPFLAEIKSNNYLLNALLQMAAQDRGGTFGIGIDAAGNVRESCVLNVVVVGHDGVLRTPPFVRVLCGTTVRRTLELARSQLLVTGLISGISQGEMPVADLRAAREVMLMAGDTHVYPVTSLDGAPIGDGKVGPVAKGVIAMLEADARAEFGTENHQELTGVPAEGVLV